jgi:hypothetical protein
LCQRRNILTRRLIPEVGVTQKIIFMKLKIYVVALIGLFVFSQCKKQKEVKGDKANGLPENISINKVVSQDLRNTLSSNFQSFKSMIIKIDQDIVVDAADFSNAYISSIKNSEGEALAINLKNTNSTEIQYAFVLYKKGSKIGKPNLVKFIGRNHIEYYDLNDELINILSITESGVKTTITPFGNKTGHKTTVSNGCGQAVADCIADAYVNHGWASVWTFVQSIYIPATSVAITGACIAKNCL